MTEAAAEWSVSVAHVDDGRLLGIVTMADLPAVDDIVSVPVLVPHEPDARAAVQELIAAGTIPGALPYRVITVDAEESDRTASVTVRQVEGGIRQIGI